jgi:hypothetical protein
VTIPNSVTTLDYYTFQGCSGLTNVTIGKSVAMIGDYAFAYCSSLINVTIPKSVTRIGSYAFRYCSNLRGAYFEGNAPIGNCNIFASDDSATVYYLPGGRN